MTVTTNIQDVLPDGTITKLSFSIPSVLTIILCRASVDEAFEIESCEITSDDEAVISDAVKAIRAILIEHEIDIIIPVANRKTR